MQAAGTGHGLAPAILTDSRALVPFGRTIVGTVAKDGKAPLNVASAQLKRPPEGSLMAPLETLTTSSPFGFRISPLTGTVGDFHLGQDFAADCGSRVYSADAGVVRAAGWHPWGGGNRVEIDHGNGLITTYNHLEAIAVRAGDTVQVGQVIARVGSTGWSTGCHLHLETILHGEHTSPLNWTFLPIRQVDDLQDIPMVSYAGAGSDKADTQRWAIPVAADNRHTVVGGEKELPHVPEAPATAPPTTPADAPAATAPSSGPSSTGTETATGSATPTAIASETPTASGTDATTGTASPTPSVTESATGAQEPSPSDSFPGWQSWQAWWAATASTAEATPAPAETTAAPETTATPETTPAPSETASASGQATDTTSEATVSPDATVTATPRRSGSAEP